jgi:GT2 family glycosyltransferase
MNDLINVPDNPNTDIRAQSASDNTDDRDPLLGMVTVLYQGMENLPGFFESLAAQTYKNTRLYLIDNSPGEDILQEAKRLMTLHGIGPVTFHRNDQNEGAARGNNQGIELALADGCEYLLLFNNDIEFPADTIRSTIAHAVTAGENLVAPKIYFAGTNLLWMAGGRMLDNRGINSHRGIRQEDTGQFDQIEYVGYAPTTFLLFRREVFDTVGRIDESYFAYFEDTDFVVRALRMGYKISYFPHAVVHHKVSSTTGGKESLFSIYYLNRNRIYFIRKHYRGLQKLRALVNVAREKWPWYRKSGKEQRRRFRTAIWDGFRVRVR